MNFEVDDKTLKINLVGSVDSNNADSVASKIDDIIGKNEHESLVLDASELTYISSAGIRVLLKVAKTETKFRIVNVISDVYDIFDMTGLTMVLDISRKLREVSLEDAKLIGRGFFSEVYRINKDTIVKVFTKTSNYGEVKKELDLAKQAFILGLPTAISYDVVNVHGRLGVVFELLDCKSLRDEIFEHPENLTNYMKEYAKLLRTINTTNVGSSILPKAKDMIIKKINFIKSHLTDEEFDKINSLVNNIPDEKTFVHGDCQIKNIMLNKNEALLIDMETLSAGAPIFELASIYASYKAFGEIQKGYEGAFFELPNDVPAKIFDLVIRNYFIELSANDLQENIEKISLVSYVHMMWWLLVNGEKYNSSYKDDFSYMYERFKSVLAKVDNLELKKFL